MEPAYLHLSPQISRRRDEKLFGIPERVSFEGFVRRRRVTRRALRLVRRARARGFHFRGAYGLPERPGQRHDGRVKSRATRLRLLRERLALDGDESGFLVLFSSGDHRQRANERLGGSDAAYVYEDTVRGPLRQNIREEGGVFQNVQSLEGDPGVLSAAQAHEIGRDVQADDVVFRPDSLRHAFRRIPVRAADVHAHFPRSRSVPREATKRVSRTREQNHVGQAPERPGVARLARTIFARRSTAAAASSRSVAGFGDEVERVALERGRRGDDRGHLGGIRTARFRRHPDASARRARRGMGRDDVVVSSRDATKDVKLEKSLDVFVKLPSAHHHSAWREPRSGLVRGRDGVIPAAARLLQAVRTR